MRKVVVTLLTAILTISAWAVDLPKQGFGLHIGYAQPTLRLNDPTNVLIKDSLSKNIRMTGFKVGLVYDASYIAGFGSSIGINYTFGVYNGGWESRNPRFGDYPKDRTLITYNELEVFVDWQYKFEIAKETYLILYTGPTIQCGLTLDWRRDTKSEDYKTGDISVVYGDQFSAYKTESNDDAFNRFNVTWGVGAGFQYKRYFLRGGYDFGLIVPFKNKDFVKGHHARGRLDQWSIKIGMYLWYDD